MSSSPAAVKQRSQRAAFHRARVASLNSDAKGAAAMHANPESTAGRKAALKHGLALRPAHPGGNPGFPITDAAHWEKARQAVGRAGSPARRAPLAPPPRKTAPMFGKTQEPAASGAAAGAATS